MLSRAAVSLRREIEQRDLTHEAVEALLDLAPRSGQITRLLSGERKPGRSLSFKIETHFAIPMSWWELAAAPGEAA